MPEEELTLKYTLYEVKETFRLEAFFAFAFIESDTLLGSVFQSNANSSI